VKKNAMKQPVKRGFVELLKIKNLPGAIRETARGF